MPSLNAFSRHCVRIRRSDAAFLNQGGVTVFCTKKLLWAFERAAIQNPRHSSARSSICWKTPRPAWAFQQLAP